MDKYLPIENPWFTGSGTYVGPATLKAAGIPDCTGDAEVTWDDIGNTETVVRLAPQFFSSSHAVMEADAVELTVNTNEGVFTAKRAFAFHREEEVDASGRSSLIKFVATESEFVASGSASAKYWAAPLVNFISRFKFRRDDLDRHPLRIFPTPEIPADEPNKGGAALKANSRNKLILFGFNSTAGYVEPLSAYPEIEKRLRSHQIDRAATALMVGEIPASAALDVSSVRAWFPFEYLYALGVATGVFVGLGFIELRDASGAFVRRVHLSARAPKYVDGPAAIDELFSTCIGSPTGSLMEKVLAALPSSAALRSVGNFIMGAGAENVIEDSADFTIRALEALTNDEALGKQNLLDGVPSVIADSVKTELKNAATAIKGKAQTALNSGDNYTADRLNRIADRTMSAAQTEAMFGLAVVALLKKYGFNDESVLNSYLATKNPGLTWAALLSKLRGSVIHTGYIDVKTKAELLSMHAYIRHIRDVVLRLFLRRVGYAGTYQPSVAEYAATTKTLDWVQATTPPNELRLS